MKKLKNDWNEAAEQRLTGLNELDEFCLKAYESSDLYKEKMKKTMTKRLRNAILWLEIWYFYSILGCVCFRANSSSNGLVLT